MLHFCRLLCKHSGLSSCHFVMEWELISTTMMQLESIGWCSLQIWKGEQLVSWTRKRIRHTSILANAVSVCGCEFISILAKLTVLTKILRGQGPPVKFSGAQADFLGGPKRISRAIQISEGFKKVGARALVWLWLCPPRVTNAQNGFVLLAVIQV